MLKEAARGAEEALPPVAIWLMAWRVLGRVGCAGTGADTEAEALDRDADEEATLGADAEAAAGGLPELGRRNWGGGAGADTEAEALDRDADEEATLGADVEAAAGALPESRPGLTQPKKRALRCREFLRPLCRNRVPRNRRTAHRVAETELPFLPRPSALGNLLLEPPCTALKCCDQ